MGLRWVVDFDPGNISIATEGSLRSVRECQDDHEIVESLADAFNLWPIRRRHGDRHRICSTAAASTASASATGVSTEPGVLQLRGIGEARTKSREISGDRVTRTAGLRKIRLTGLRIADQHIELDRRTARRRALSLRCGDDAVDVLRDGFDVVCG